jgi:hypothetical protein
MPIKKTRSGEPMEKTLAKKLQAVVSTIASLATGMIQRRTAKAQDMRGGAFPAYSRSYQKQLVEGGELTKVDLTVTGAYLADIGERKRVTTQSGITVTIGPGSGTSEQRDFQDGVAKHTGRRSPPHNVLAEYLSVKFKHLGLTPEEQKRLAAKLRELLNR